MTLRLHMLPKCENAKILQNRTNPTLLILSMVYNSCEEALYICDILISRLTCMILPGRVQRPKVPTNSLLLSSWWKFGEAIACF